MNTKLQELTEKIYAEGVEKGKSQAAEIVAEAQAKADKIIAEARTEAEKIVADAETKAAELDKNTRSELRLFAQQAVNALKTEVTDLVTDRLANESIKAANPDGKFMQQMILKMCEKWAAEGRVVIETKDAKALTDYFNANAKALLAKGVEIKETKGIKTDFTIAPEKGGYKISFGDAEFVEYFKEFLRPQLVEMLF